MDDELDTKLRRTLRLPTPSAGLRDQLHANLRVQRRGTTHSGAVRGAIAALVVLCVVFAGIRFQSSDHDVSALVAAARQHAQDEATLHELDLDGLRAWLRSVDAAAPASQRLEMFKTCIVDGVAVKHLRLRLDGGAVADLMVDTSGRWRTLAASRSHPGWLIARPRANVSLVAVFSPNREAEVAGAVEALFPDSNTSLDANKEV